MIDDVLILYRKMLRLAGRRLLQLITHPIVLFVLLAGSIYAVWFLTDKSAKVAMSALSALAALGIGRFYYATNRVNRALREVQEGRDHAWSPQLENERVLLRTALRSTEILPPDVETHRKRRRASEVAGSQKALYVRGVELTNIRCFRGFGLSFEAENEPYLTTIILGDNATGKSTLLRSIALGLCAESDAVSLIKKLPGRIIRDGATRGSIVLHLRSYDRTFEGSIHTSIEVLGDQEVIRQTTYPLDFPWQEIFVCGYGTQRTSGRPSSHESYTPRLSVATLFSDTADLLNPEVVLLRRDQKTSRRLESILKHILLLEGVNNAIKPSERGIELAGPWGSQPLSAVSDGYRSTSQWVLDYLGWQVFASRLRKDGMNGVLLLDELEQHLHPRWQRYFVQRLRVQLDETQLIASSHTPLIAAGVADVSRSQVVRLITTVDGSVESIRIPSSELTGKRADQILADAFGLVTSKSPGSLSKIDRYTELMSRSRNVDEEKEFEVLQKELRDSWSTEDSRLKRVADRAVSKVLDEMIDQAAQGVDLQVKHRLLELFDSEKK